MAQEPKGVSIPLLAGVYGVSESLLYALANAGRLPGCRRLGRRFVIHRETFENWVRCGGEDAAGPGTHEGTDG
jgi:excisionase family DNA binding protein